MKAAAVFHYNWPTEFEYIWRRKGNLGCSLCHEFCLSCRAEHKFCVSFLQCKLGVCGSTIICGGASWRGILLVLSFSINCNEAIGYGGQNHESRVSLFIAIAFALNYRSLFRESDSLWHLSWLPAMTEFLSCSRPEEMMSFVCSPSQCSPPNVHTKSPLNNNPLSH